MSTHERLTRNQRAIIGDWLDDGYTSTQIVKKIERQRMANVIVPDDEDDGYGEGSTWPSVTLQAIEYYRKRRGELAPDRENAISVASGTMLGTKAAHLRRIADQVGKLEELMDETYTQLLEEIQAGALKGVPVMELKHPSYVQAEYAVDGVDMGLTSVQSEDIVVDESIDYHRTMRAIAIMNVLQKLYMAWEKLMGNAQKVSGLHNPLLKDEHALAVTAEENATVKRLFEQFSRSHAQGPR